MSKRVFITGASSVVGLTLIRRLLLDTSDQLYLLVRKLPNARDPRTRIFQLIEEFFPELNLQNYSDRLHVITGDIAKRNLGIQDKDFEDFCERGLDQIIHLAAFTDRRLLTKERLFQTNVEGSQRLFRFGRRLKVKKYIALGNLYAGRNLSQSFEDLDELEESNNFNNINEFIHQLTAQNLVRLCRESGIRWNILRCGYFLDQKISSLSSRRWYYHVCKSIFEVMQLSNQFSGRSRSRIFFPASEVEIYLSSPVTVADLLFQLSTDQGEVEDQILDTFDQRISVRHLLSRVPQATTNLELHWVTKMSELPSLEKYVFRNSLVFFEYLSKQSQFSESEWTLRLRESAQIPVRVFQDGDLRGLVAGCRALYEKDPHRIKLHPLRKLQFKLQRKMA